MTNSKQSLSVEEAKADPQAVALFERSAGKAWEPPNRDHPLIKRLIAAGYLRPCTMRCGFEAFDTGVMWTDAARDAFRSRSPLEDNSNG